MHIIAEAGTNHNGSEEEARYLIECAARSGADSVKFQIINPWGLYLPGEYEYGHYRIADVLALRHQTVLSDDTYERLRDHAVQHGVVLSASVFDSQGLALLCRLHPPYIKIASTDLNNVRFLREVAATPYPLIVSTGMSTLAEIERAVRTIARERALDSLVLMHCVSIYPARTDDMNLPFLRTLANTFGTAVGFSDHTQHSLAAAAALAFGASWIEKHFTRDRTQRGLDHAYAMEEAGFTQYVADLRGVWQALQPPAQKVGDREQATRRRARRALYAARDIATGERIRDEDVLCVRPEGPLNADQIEDIVGRTAVAAIPRHAPFRLDLVR